MILSSGKRLLLRAAMACAIGGAFTACASKDYAPTAVVKDGVVVSVRDQKLAVIRDGKLVKTYPVSTSKFGLGDRKGSCRTPLGQHRIVAKIGANQPPGTVFRSRRPTGERVAPNATGRDPIVSRILWLDGLQACNRNAHSRMIYIHGTAEERTIGTPASYGCIRMKSKDVCEAYDLLANGDTVVVEQCSIKASMDALKASMAQEADNTTSPEALPAVNLKPVNNSESGASCSTATTGDLAHKVGKTSRRRR